LTHFDYGVEMGSGHTIPGDRPLWDGTTMSRLWVTTPLVEIIPTLHLAEGIHVEFLQVVPLFEEEFGS
jgi:hypothetical protein